jgi:prepilin peptidase CpaA
MVGQIPLSAILVALAFALLVAGGVEDARHRTIGNGKNAALALLAPVWWWSLGLAPWPDMALQLGVATLVFLPFVGLFALGWMGGGDVKLLGALALWLPLGAFAEMLVIMSIAGGAITLLLMVEARLRRREGAIEVPYGIAIAGAALPLIAGTVS